MPAPQGLSENIQVLPPTLQTVANELVKLGQEHLFENWPAPGVDDDQKIGLVQSLAKFEETYPGGVKSYCKNARKLLADSREEKNPFEGYTPEVPEGEKLNVNTQAFEESEKLGLEQMKNAAFVLVAGGLGERLGYEGIKISLPSEISTGTSFMGLYADRIKALARASKATSPIPLAIMTSGDTDDLTRKLLHKNKNYGLDITLIKQDKVPSLSDANAKFCLESPYELQTKPHGHGDVHGLLLRQGLIQKWLDEGRKWLVFIQDTNALVFNALPAALGVSQQRQFEVNSLTVAREPGEAVGGIARLRHRDGQQMTVNVEYNQLGPLLKSTVNPKGDVADETGKSPFPGNTNVLIFALPPYLENLKKSSGEIPEFVNPKYTDKSRETFLKPTRLECMMQDYPKLLKAGAVVGFSQFERWLSFSAVKNHLQEASHKRDLGLPPEGAASAEMDLYEVGARLLASAGMKLSENETVSPSLQTSPHVVFLGGFAPLCCDVQKKVSGGSISPQSTLILDGEDIEIENLELKGTLIVRAVVGAKVRISNLKVHNLGWKQVPLEGDSTEKAELKIRGYRLERLDQRELIFDQPGTYHITR